MNNDNKDNNIDPVDELTRLAFQNEGQSNNSEIEVLNEEVTVNTDSSNVVNNSNVQSAMTTNDIPVNNSQMGPVINSVNNNVVNNVPVNNIKSNNINVTNATTDIYMQAPVRKKKNIFKIVIPIFILVIVAVGAFILFTGGNGILKDDNKLMSSKEIKLSSLGISKNLTEESVEKLINEKIIFYSNDENAINIMRFVKYNNRNVVEMRRLKMVFEGRNAIYEYPYIVKDTIGINDGMISSSISLIDIKSVDNKLVVSVKNETPVDRDSKFVGEYKAYKEEDYIELPFYSKGEFSGEYHPSSSEREGNIVVLYDEENDWYILYGKITRDGKSAVITGSVKLENNTGVTLSNLGVSFGKNQLIVTSSGYEELDRPLTGGYLRNNTKKLIDVISYIDSMVEVKDLGSICSPCEE